MNTKQAGMWALACIGILALMTFAFKDAGAIFSVTVWYSLLVLVPGLVWILPLEQGLAETFLLSNILGFSFAAVLVPLDIWAGVPMNKLTFAAVAVIAIITGVIRWKSYYLAKAEQEEPAASEPVESINQES